jgi:hypothetical protein
VITVASPHQGTESLRAFPFAVGSLQVGHAGLTRLPPLDQLVKRSAVIASAVDVIVYPKASSQPAGSDAFHFDDVGHAALLVDDAVAQRVAALVLAMIEEAAPFDGTPGS